jgi:hypothetical protein
MKKITVTNELQKKYIYELSEPMGKHFDPEFKPQLTPKEMLELGIFGGVYFASPNNEFPADWFTNAKLTSGKRDAKLNYFKVHASQSRAIWIAKGWMYRDDPRGWFEWYCRYFMGRRIPDEDKRQIKRWIAIRRHVGAVVANCRAGDVYCRPRQRQALLHWAYDSRKL